MPRPIDSKAAICVIDFCALDAGDRLADVVCSALVNLVVFNDGVSSTLVNLVVFNDEGFELGAIDCGCNVGSPIVEFRLTDGV